MLGILYHIQQWLGPGLIPSLFLYSSITQKEITLERLRVSMVFCHLCAGQVPYHCTITPAPELIFLNSKEPN